MNFCCSSIIKLFLWWVWRILLLYIYSSLKSNYMGRFTAYWIHFHCKFTFRSVCLIFLNSLDSTVPMSDQCYGQNQNQNSVCFWLVFGSVICILSLVFVNIDFLHFCSWGQKCPRISSSFCFLLFHRETTERSDLSSWSFTRSVFLRLTQYQAKK